MPLVYAGATGVEQQITDQHERARKIMPQYAQGDLVRVAGARNQAEGEFVQGLLLEEGVPSLLRRARGFDVPDYLAAGPRDVLVPASGVQTAREVLLQAELIDDRTTAERPWRLLAGLLVALVLVAVVLWLGTDVLA